MRVSQKRGRFKKGELKGIFRKDSFKNIAAMIIGLVVLASLLPASYIFAAEKQPFEGSPERTTELANHNAMTEADSKTLVIYFSRSGNTERMAMEIAKYYQATLVHLEATDYRPGFSGLINAVKDSRSKHAAITPEKLDLSSYQTLFIGSPIWGYSPAPPAWQFVENNNFTDKKVVLFTTFNSSFKQQYIDEFQAQVEGKDGHFIKHIYVERGRMMRQINLETLLKKTREELGRL